jgi:hypothetical protein
LPVVFDEIVTHERPHLDEIVAIWLLRRFGEARFPGVSQAKVSYTTTGRRGPDAKESEARGVLMLGIGGGRFDEHPTLDIGRKAEECCATLVARELGVLDDPSLQKILKFVKSRDLEGNSTPFDLSYLVKLLHPRFPDNPEKVIEWTLVGIEAKYEEQHDFFFVARQEFESKARIDEVPAGTRRLRIATIESDSESVGKYARSEFGGYAGIVIQKRASGNVSILVNKQMGLDMRDVVRMIRLAERQAKRVGQGSGAGGQEAREQDGECKLQNADCRVQNGKGGGRGGRASDKTPEPRSSGTPEPYPAGDLAAEGVVRGAEEWFFHERGQMLLNGSLTATGVTPTRLTLDQIREIVSIGIVPGALRALCASTGKCAGGICDWHQWDMARCRALRQGSAS